MNKVPDMQIGLLAVADDVWPAYPDYVDCINAWCYSRETYLNFAQQLPQQPPQQPPQPRQYEEPEEEEKQEYYPQP